MFWDGSLEMMPHNYLTQHILVAWIYITISKKEIKSSFQPLKVMQYPNMYPFQKQQKKKSLTIANEQKWA